LDVSAQNLVPNPGFEAGESGPAEWRLYGSGEWSPIGRESGRCAKVRGDGRASSEWRSRELELQPGALYRLSCLGRSGQDTSGGTAVLGTGRVNRDFRFAGDWQPFRFVFSAPETGAGYVRLGQWEVKGEVFFDEVELVPVVAVHERGAGALELGEGESIQDGLYHFRPDFNWFGGNYHRPLARNRAGFNSNRWLFSPGAEVVYRHALEGIGQSSGRVRVYINYHTGGELKVEASSEGQRWAEVAKFDGAQRGGWVNLPTNLYPAAVVWVRLSQAGAGSGFQVDGYEYEAALDRALPGQEGRTHFMALKTRHSSLGVYVKAIQAAEMSGQCTAELVLTNRTDKAVRAQAGAGRFSSVTQAVALAPGQTRELVLSTEVVGAGSQVVPFAILDEHGAQMLWAGETEMRTSFLGNLYYGHALAGLEGLATWWCESGWKVGRERRAPRPMNESPRPVSVTAARGEYEAAQVVLHPSRDGQLLAAQVEWEPPAHAAGAGAASPIRTEICEVAYVYVAQPTDDACVRGWYPDPLPPLQTPLALRAGMNQPLWITFQVPRAAAPGPHRGALKLETSFGQLKIPVMVGVYKFELPRATHLRSSLGLSPQAINQYHRLTQPEHQRLVYEKYLRNFAEHRISPYRFDAYSPIGISFVGDGNKHARVDFTAFEAAAGQWLDEYGFTSFQLPLRGMGGGTFHSRRLGELEGFKEGTPEHARLFGDYLGQIERRLREKGWLERAFTYWFDEPDPKDYEFVVAGMKRLKEAAPGLKRLLTEQPEPALLGQVDIWCGLTPEWTREKVAARRAVGEEVWWYICCGPRSPYVTEFIDHPGTELRLWPWQSWQYGVTGLLVWETVYWTSPLAYPRPKLQDPWSDPMSWVSGYGNPVDFKSPWGNGDGRFLYPPRPRTGGTEALLESPVSSIRWENLRDGIEDYEYLWLLKEMAKDSKSADVLGEARKLLEVPADISRDLTHFTTDPRDILAHRERVARLIERL
jgi:hypothetical protein